MAETKPLWGKIKIPVLGLTGEFESGKTLFALSVDPNVFATDAEPMTLLWDTEGSASSYVDSLNFVHRDLAETMRAKFPKGYKPIDLFETWYVEARNVEIGKYRVLGLDVVSEIEEGLVDWVRANPEEFGHTKGQYAKMSGLVWGDVKSLWKRILTDIAARCETFVFTAHTRSVWRGDKPVPGKRQPKGKETLMELASLYLWLDRTPEPGKPKAPRKFYPILPPRLPEATPDAIRAYIESPPDYAKLKKGEQATDETLTPAEELAIRAEIAENEAVAAQAKLSTLEAMKSAARQQAAAMQPATTPLPDEPVDDRRTAKTTDPCDPELVAEIKRLFEQLGATVEEAQAILRKRGAERLAELSMVQAEELRDKLSQRLTEQGVEGMLPDPPKDEIPY
jgi:hypothetical protein